MNVNELFSVSRPTLVEVPDTNTSQASFSVPDSVSTDAELLPMMPDQTALTKTRSRASRPSRHSSVCRPQFCALSVTDVDDTVPAYAGVRPAERYEIRGRHRAAALRH